MMGNVKFLDDIKESKGEVTFGDGIKGKITGVGTLNVAGLPKLKKVLLVNGLHENLISISQLCDQNWNVSFTKDNCNVLDNQKQCIMEGKRSSNNCYVLTTDVLCCTSYHGYSRSVLVLRRIFLFISVRLIVLKHFILS